MRKSSLGRRSSAANFQRISTDFVDRSCISNRSGIPVFVNSVPRSRDASADRMSDYANLLSTPCTSGTLRTSRQLTMSTGRVSSMGGTKKADNRPLLQKEWQIEAVDLIRSTLSSDQEGCNILQMCKSMRPMTLNNFVSISNYFIRKLDPSFELTSSNYTTELVFLLKKLVYKGKVDKSLLQTVNVMHNWPYAIGILHFLGSLVQASEDFKSMGLDPLYPNNLEQDCSEKEELNFKYVIPFLHTIWEMGGKNDPNQDTLKILFDKNREKLSQVLALCGFDDDIFAEEEKAREELAGSTVECNEVQHKLENLELQHKKSTEKKIMLAKKANDMEMEVQQLKEKLQQQLKQEAELQKEIDHIDENVKNKEKLLASYQDADKAQPTTEEYEQYKKKKALLKDRIREEYNTLFIRRATHLNQTMKSAGLKRECDRLFNEYLSGISKLVLEDASVKAAMSHSRPKLGATPCNTATAQLLDRVFESYEKRISELELELRKVNDSSDGLSWEEKSKTRSAMAQLVKLRSDYHDAVEEHQRDKRNAEKILDEVIKENETIDKEIEIMKKKFDTNNEECLQLEKLCKKNEEEKTKYQAICQRKLELRYQSIVCMDQKLRAMLDEIDMKSMDLIGHVKSL